MAPTIIGRSVELNEIDEFVATADHGLSALVISGVPGIGKTTLWREARDRVRAAGAVVLESRPLEADARHSYAAITDLLLEIPDVALGAIPGPQARALAVASDRVDPSAGRLRQQTVSAGLVSLLRVLSIEALVVVAIDDVQWLDVSSARVIEAVARRSRGSRITFIVAQRTDLGAVPQVPLGLASSLAADGVKHVVVAPMTNDELQRVISAALGEPISERVMTRVARSAAGNPLFAIEIARTIQADPRSEANLGVPMALVDLVASRIKGLPARAHELLLGAALLSEPRRRDVIAAATGPAWQKARALDDAEDAGIVTVDRDVRFVHPLLATAVAASATISQRRAMHRRLAAVVSGLEERARHLALASDAPDERTARALMAAAGLARRRGAPDAAADLAEMAAGLTPDHRQDRKNRRLIDTAELRLHAGQFERAARLLESLLREPLADLDRSDALRVLGDVRLQQNSTSVAVAVYAEAFQAAVGDHRRAALAELGRTYASVSAGRFEEIGPSSAAALSLARETHDGALIAEALAVSAIATFLLGDGLDDAALAEALELEDHDRSTVAHLRPSLIAGLLYHYVGRRTESRRLLLQLRDRLVDRGEEAELPQLLGNLAWLEILAGDIAAAVRYAEEGMAVAESTLGVAITATYATLAYGWMGDRAQTEAADARAEESMHESEWQIGRLWSRWGRAELELADDRPERAVDALEHLIRLVEGGGVPDPVRYPFVPTAIDAYVAMGRLANAERLLEMWEQCPATATRPWARLTGLRARAAVTLAQADPVGAETVLNALFSDAAIEEFPLERAKSRLVAARTKRAQRQRRAAFDAYTDAAMWFERAGAGGWANAALRERGRLGVERSASGLTPSEILVAWHAANGMTNREVADRLAISPKTVEATLSRVYHKLAIRRRAELGALRPELDPSRGHGGTPADH